MRHWFAVQCKPRQESLADENLQRQGYVTYLPRIRQRRLRRRQWVSSSEPLFPRYLFIHVDEAAQSLAPVRSTLGVSDLVRFGHLLRPVPEAVIDYLRAAESETGERVEEEWPFGHGDSVEVLDGPLAGLEGVFQHPVAEARAMLLLDLLGRTTPVAVEMKSLASTRS